MSAKPAIKRGGEDLSSDLPVKRANKDANRDSNNSNEANTSTIASVYKEKQSGAFAFSFGGSNDTISDEDNENDTAVSTSDSNQANTNIVQNDSEHVLCSTEKIARSSVICRALRDVWAPGMADKVHKGSDYAVDWEKSSGFSLCVSDAQVVDGNGIKNQKNNEYFVPPSAVRLLRTSTDEKTRTLKCDVVTNEKGILHYDSTWTLLSKVLGYDMPYNNTPSLLEPGLESFVWPISVDIFMKTIYQQRALVVHGTGQRLEELRKDFNDLDVEEMVQDASRVVVWMKTKQGKMQYIDAGPDIAINCYRAGHTLYFNPSLDVQKKYFDALTDSLGMKCIDFGLNGLDDIGGDIEIFAVDRAHDTPWHFDAQENFSIQLKGTKRWSVCKSDLKDIITNLHPDSSNIEAVYNDYKAHSGYTGTRPRAPKEENGDEIYTFVLRPGSILYAPAGMWHRVQCEDEDGGSLSMNFSVDGRRWSDLFASRIQPLLWKNQGWRGRIQDMTPDKARETLGALLEELKQDVNKLTADDFLPPAILDTNIVSDDGDSKIRLFRVHAEIGDEGREMRQAIIDGQAVRERYPEISSASFRRNPLCDLTLESTSATGMRWTVNSGYTKDSLASEYCRGIFVPHECCTLLMQLMNHKYTSEKPIKYEQFLEIGKCDTGPESNSASATEIAETLSSILVFTGYLHLC